ncbi:LytTR family DNA-binding domain-containing protein [uncultured Phocaeicola sp.]|jgi:DNA-binding LytR/AlgR family response regulator|uniref:LytR/AlgR family response regulator transcription factor n=1 Tax=uncultured Phocaeicola sp. TaxID=990718 RepID=UPI0025AE6293|nr:LytTR family DNA-binding domain-containing protein [uncultured Phocaeicola sp.]
MFRIAICDDESFFAEELKELISGYMMEKGLVFEIDTYSSGEALVKLGIEVVRYTAVFLDINMEKIDGIKAAEKIREVSREVFIVFVTAYVNYSLEGYRLDAVRYLLKSNANFQSTVNECMNAIMEKLNYSVAKREFDFKEGTKEVSLERLLYIESNLHKLEFHIMEDDMKIYTMYETLNALEDRLAANDFVRIHQSYLVNIKYIKNVVRYKVVLTNGVELVIPKARYTYVKEQFVSYQGEV